MVVPLKRAVAPASISRLDCDCHTLAALISSVALSPTTTAAVVKSHFFTIDLRRAGVRAHIHIAVNGPIGIGSGDVEFAAVELDEATQRFIGAGAEVQVQNGATTDGDHIRRRASAVGIEIGLIDVHDGGGIT